MQRYLTFGLVLLALVVTGLLASAGAFWYSLKNVTSPRSKRRFIAC